MYLYKHNAKLTCTHNNLSVIPYNGLNSPVTMENQKNADSLWDWDFKRCIEVCAVSVSGQINLQIYAQRYNNPEKKTITVWSSGVVSMLQDCFECTN